ncbi:MAG: alpha/beta hydrolase family protein, partial [Bacteroidales bacterium]
IMDKCSFPGGLKKAKKSDILIWQKGSFENYPELYFSDMKFFSPIKVSVTNPQQSSYIWGTVELVFWMSFDHKELQGLLYKPENFDPSKKYPMIVYFYERSSDGMYSYIAPAPSASTINRTFAVSNGYLVFVPDIVYTTGFPGRSCYDAVVSGTFALVNKYSFIDKDHIGLDGQSWGGYQVAYLVTRTNLFACAFAGAPVINMISAYGGIRWETGMSRMFQYEMTQSRIGGTLWDKPLLFIENSPVFRIPEINTPLLIMHNDADGAVPWYQGIEFITALRRLGKPAWMLSYNDEAHNLAKRPARKDLSVRKMQFFDHYLKNAPIPYWMKYGISQAEKGKIDGYELVKN